MSMYFVTFIIISYSCGVHCLPSNVFELAALPRCVYVPEMHRVSFNTYTPAQGYMCPGGKVSYTRLLGLEARFLFSAICFDISLDAFFLLHQVKHQTYLMRHHRH